MKKNIPFASIFSFLFLIGIGGVFSYLHVGKPYQAYRMLSEYRRLHPDILPSTTTLRIASVGHMTTYADILWMELIQFIADNIGNGRYLDFTHRILTQIQELHPRFARAYELDLLFLPVVHMGDESDKSIQDKKIIQEALTHFESKLPEICDMSKIQEIRTLPFGHELSERGNLRNPCISPMIPYYMAARYENDLSQRLQASQFYKIASMHDGAPAAAEFLGILSYSSAGNRRDGAITFALLAASGYDAPPYTCQIFAERLANDLIEKTPWTRSWIQVLEQEEKNLKNPATPDNPLSLAGGTCYESLERGIKQIYLGYITEITQAHPDIKTEADIIDTGLLDHIPTIQSQSGYTIIKRDGIWQYRERF